MLDPAENLHNALGSRHGLQLQGQTPEDGLLLAGGERTKMDGAVMTALLYATDASLSRCASIRSITSAHGIRRKEAKGHMILHKACK